MKKLFFCFALTTCVIACNNSGGGNAAKDSTGPGTPAVDNVNGNVPETTNTTNLNQPMQVDSSRLKDSMKKKH